ncbi:hypothetical protein ABZX93_12515 [Streptomyces sp. NPDC006632]|uniref:hypothetical protein n=1 Tax=Streptomyces sp. NPDC006632 TaxID=3157182 RepID=UPI0033AA3B2D
MDAVQGWGNRSYAGGLSVTVHDGALHVLVRLISEGAIEGEDGPLWHPVYDGSTWTDPVALAEPSRRSSALTSYDGKLHAVYPHSTRDELLRTTLGPDGWSRPRVIEGHASRNTPALLPFRDGQGESERLLLVHRGVDRYVAPELHPANPPEVRTVFDETSSPLVTDHSLDAWSRAQHKVMARAVEFTDGSRGLIGAFVGRFTCYSRSGGYYSDASSIDATLILTYPSKATTFTPISVEIVRGFGSAVVSWHHLEPGEYQVSLVDHAEKTEGYWYTAESAGNSSDIPLSVTSTPITVPAAT